MISAPSPPAYPLILSKNRSLRYGVFFFLYAMQGIPPGFYLTALPNYFTAEGISPNVVSSFIAVIGLPWAFQFIWGPLIDRFQGSPLGRRRPWVAGSQLLTLLASCVLLLVTDPVEQISTLAWLFGLRSVFAAIQDAGVDAMAITVIPENERGRANAFMRAGFLVGTGIGAAVFAPVLRQYGFHAAALLQIAFLSTGILLIVFVREQPTDRLFPSFGQLFASSRRSASQVVTISATKLVQPNFRWLFTELFRGLFATRSLLLFGAILLAYTGNALFLRAYNYHLIETLGWSDTDVSILTGTYGMLLATIIALTGGYLTDRLGAGKTLLVTLGLIALYLIGFNLLSSLWVQRTIAQTGLISLYFLDPAVSASAMPILMSICRKGVEGSQFTTYMAFVNLCDIAGTYFAGNALLFIRASDIGLLAGGFAVLAALSLFFTLRHFGNQ